MPDKKSDETVRVEMAIGVLKGTHDRLHGKEASIPIGIDPKTGDLFTDMPPISIKAPDNIDEDEDNISDLHDYDDLDKAPS
jgi:hypothetical protein